MKRIFGKILNSYQQVVSPLLHFIFGSSIVSGCRFYPTCSEYCKEAIDQFGLAKGLTKSFYRLGRCHPFSRGGIDFV